MLRSTVNVSVRAVYIQMLMITKKGVYVIETESDVCPHIEEILYS